LETMWLSHLLKTLYIADILQGTEIVMHSEHRPGASHLKAFKTVAAKHPTMWSLINARKDGNATWFDEKHISIPFEVRYQLEVCISQGYLNEHNITEPFLRSLTELALQDKAKARTILEWVAEQEVRVFDPMKIFSNQEALSYFPNSKIPHYCAYARKATITPSSLLYNSPTVETTNRVTRKFAAYGDRFLRIQFTDEKAEGRISACADKARNDELFSRVYRTLMNGIRIGDRHYQFLAFGNSQFRENGAFFFCETPQLSCQDIRDWMGNFDDIKVVAKYAARLGLCYSTTRAIHSARPKIVKLEDVDRNGYTFTDGVGKISDLLAKLIAHDLGITGYPPSAFQFRMGGCKGILAVSPDAKGQEIHIRKSQQKFSATYNGLEIIRCSQFAVASLNRQTISILTSLGVPDQVRCLHANTQAE
jgi:RNA-dependent RNA polymerase